MTGNSHIRVATGSRVSHILLGRKIDSVKNSFNHWNSLRHEGSIVKTHLAFGAVIFFGG